MFATQTGQDMTYVPKLAPAKGFATELRAFIALGARGANVTVPFKLEAIAIATQLSVRAKLAGAVNTLCFNGDEIYGDNTDGIGLLRDLMQNHQLKLAGRRVLLLGAGGAARGVLRPLLDEQPADLIVANRTEARAQRLVAEIGPAISSVAAVSLPSLAGEHFDVIINASSAGLDEAGTSPLNGVSPAPTGEFAYDMMYGRETQFMAHARAQGLRVADGLGMLVEQAAEPFYLWRGIRPDTKPVLAALRADLGNKH